MTIKDHNILITGAARRVGRSLALAVARAGGNVVIHYGSSANAAEETRAKILAMGRQAHILGADLSDAQQVIEIIPRALEYGPLYALVNSAAIFEPLAWDETTLEDWERHMMINLTAPFLLSQAFAKSLPGGQNGKIVNILDWRALRPGADHFPYTISKSGLVALTQSLAQALAPQVIVNGLALGAILPPSDGAASAQILDPVPLGRWADLEEVNRALLFLLEDPPYMTGEILHIDGGRHLV